ncbi:hypothetical protein, partial [Cohnella sp.]|uniref:hypothetical protein n=1 Tax=Cohnella sp. TaxID=1883426 RepID=UPI002581180E
KGPTDRFIEEPFGSKFFWLVSQENSCLTVFRITLDVQFSRSNHLARRPSLSRRRSAATQIIYHDPFAYAIPFFKIY